MNENQDCLAYAGLLQVEHQALHQRLRSLQAEFNNVAAPRVGAALQRSMLETGTQLRADLAHHFAQEENGGCLDYAASRVPAVAGIARELEHEHPLLLAHLDEMLQELRLAPPDTLYVATIKEKFDALVVKLLAHEERENRIVQRGFNMELD
ncbi:MAG TPA: hemerythrin domain-containing protein [Pirellulaceae bacterium]|nr:hemerythrin domain-containing protein [Pirellulaceae bacterium]